MATIGLILATSIPVILLSALFGYLLARGLTKRLESLSRVTAAIGAGDLSRRATVDTRNEIGRLADDVNRMAERLQGTMQELTLARGEAEASLKARRELVAAISHELRTPLAVLQAQLDALEMAESKTAVSGGPAGSLDIALRTKTLDVVRGQTAQLASLVDDLFALAQADTRTLTVRRVPVDVSLVVENVVSSMRPWRDASALLHSSRSRLVESPGRVAIRTAWNRSLPT